MNIIRNEVERVIKEYKLNRTRIFEVSKQTYEFVIQKIESSFAAYQWNKGTIHWAEMGHFKSDLPCASKQIYNNAFAFSNNTLTRKTSICSYGRYQRLFTKILAL